MVFHYILQSVFVGVGILAVLASVFNSNWLFDSPNARFIVSVAGRKKARIFYAALGGLMIATGIYFFMVVQGYA